VDAVRVLLVCNQLLVRAGLRHLLERAGIVLAGEATTCQEALMLTARERPDIVVLDLDSPTEAFVCLERLASAPEPARVIALSDRNTALEHASFVELGAVGLVMKHETPEVLFKAIEKVHAGELWLDRTNTAHVLRRMTRRRLQQSAEAARIASLTKREHQIIALVGEGLKNAAIADRLFISEATVRNHVTSILDKLGVSDRFELAVYAFKQGLVSPTTSRFDPPQKRESADRGMAKAIRPSIAGDREK
jgi:two-component system, NarL family, nitrate/nitrite response regulator NarL